MEFQKYTKEMVYPIMMLTAQEGTEIDLYNMCLIYVVKALW